MVHPSVRLAPAGHPPVAPTPPFRRDISKGMRDLFCRKASKDVTFFAFWQNPPPPLGERKIIIA